MARKMTRPKTGTIFRFKLPDGGLGYGQYLMRHPMMGCLIRVFSGARKKEPDFSALAEEKEQFITFFPLPAATNQGYTEVVGVGCCA